LGSAAVHRCFKSLVFVLSLILGGAAVYRCDKRLVLSRGFSRRGRLRRSSRVYQRTL